MKQKSKLCSHLGASVPGQKNQSAKALGSSVLRAFELQQEAKRWEPKQTGEGESGPRQDSWDQVTMGLVGPGQDFSFYSTLVGNLWKVLSRVFYLFIFASMYHLRSSDSKWEINFCSDAYGILDIRVLGSGGKWMEKK